MKKIFTFWALLLAVAFCANAGLTLPRPVSVSKDFSIPKAKYEVGHRFNLGTPAPMNAKAANVNDNDALLYAFRIYAASGYMHGWYNFTANNPVDLQCVKETGSEAGDYGIASATRAKDKSFAYIYSMYGTKESGWNEIHMPIGIAVLDELTGDYELMYSTETFHTMQYNQLFYEMTYDPTTDKVYACEFAYDESGNYQDKMNIYEIDQTTCVPTLVGQMNCVIITLAAHNGELYGITQDFKEDGSIDKTRLVKVDPSNVDANGLFTTVDVCTVMDGSTINYMVQSMEFDHSTHDLWWLGYKNNKAFVGKLNTKKGSIEEEQEIPYSAQYLGLTIPFETADAAAPARVTEYSLSRPDSNEKVVTLTWKNPTKNYNLETLTELTGVKIYRDGELIHTEATTTTGAAVTWVDNTVENGTHIYKVVPYNTAGDGISREREIYAGEDVPNFVHGITTVVDGANLTLSWNAPTTGKNGCWFDAANVKYDVYRGSYAIAKGISETTINDQVTEYAAYTYRIVPFTTVGEGVSTEVSVTYGPPVGLPYENDCSDPELAEEITIIDANSDANTWYYSEGWGAFCYVAGAAYGVNIDANDYLVFPTFQATEGKKYELQFEYYTSNYYDTWEDIEIVVGNEIAADKLTNVVATMHIEGGDKGTKWYPTRAQYLATESGATNFGIHIVSKCDAGFINVKNIYIREMGDAEVSAAAVTGPTEVFTNTEYTYNVRVVNEGTTEVKGAKAMIVDDFGAEIASAIVPDLKVGDIVEVPVLWTPTSEMEIQLFGYVELAGEDYTDDNTTAEYLQVKVNKEGSDPWLSIGEIDLENYDDRVISLPSKHSRSQTLYFSDEICSQFGDLDKYLDATGNDYIEITGIRLFYGASQDADLLTEIPLVINLENTDIDGIIDPWYLGPLNDPNDKNYDPNADGIVDYIYETEGLTIVFDGVVDLSGTGENNILEVKFDQPFLYYPGKNLRLDLLKEDTETYGYVKWFLDVNNDYAGRASDWMYDGNPVPLCRAGYYNSSVPYNPDDDPSDFWGNNWHTALDWFPVVKFSYPAAPSSVDTINASALNVTVANDAINFSATCQSVEVYNLAGAKVAAYNNVNSVSVNLPAGIYIVKATAGTDTIAKKVMIK